MNALDSIKMRAGQKAVGSMLYYLKSGGAGFKDRQPNYCCTTHHKTEM